MRARRPRFLRQLHEQPERLVGDAVLRIVEVDAGGLGRHPLAAPWIVGKELAKVQVADFGIVGFEGPPCRERG